MLNKYDLVIFDWDGTIMDSIGHIVTCIQHAAIANELKVPDEQSIRDIIGMSLPNAFETLFSVDFAEKYEEFRRAYKDRYHQGDEEALPLFDGMTELLALLRHRKTKMAVATGKGRPGLDKLMETSKLGHYFEFSRTSDEAESKPSPDMLQQILTHFEIEPGNAIMIGDSIHDLNMAKQVGMDRIGVSFGAHRREKLEGFEPIAVIDSYHEIISAM